MQAVAYLGIRPLTSHWLVAFQGCSYHPCDQQQGISLVWSASYCRLAHIHAVGGEVNLAGLTASTLFGLEWAEFLQSGCRSEGTCPPCLWLAFLSYADPGLEHTNTVLTLHPSMSHAGQATRMVWSHFWRLLHMGFPPDVFLLYSHIIEGTKGQEMFLESFLH